MLYFNYSFNVAIEIPYVLCVRKLGTLFSFQGYMKTDSFKAGYHIDTKLTVDGCFLSEDPNTKRQKIKMN